MEIQSLRAHLEHQNQLYAPRLDDLEACQTDHETRLRTVQDSATQFKVLAGLATGGGLLSIIALIQSIANL